MKEVLLYYEIVSVREHRQHFENTGSHLFQITLVFGDRSLSSVEFSVNLVDK